MIQFKKEEQSLDSNTKMFITSTHPKFEFQELCFLQYSFQHVEYLILKEFVVTLQ